MRNGLSDNGLALAPLVGLLRLVVRTAREPGVPKLRLKLQDVLLPRRRVVHDHVSELLGQLEAATDVLRGDEIDCHLDAVREVAHLSRGKRGAAASARVQEWRKAVVGSHSLGVHSLQG